MADASKLVTQALDTAGATAKGLARAMKLSSSSLRKFGYGTRTPTPDDLKTLARLLRGQARRLERLSDALVKFARKESKTFWLTPRHGPPRTGK